MSALPNTPTLTIVNETTPVISIVQPRTWEDYVSEGIEIRQQKDNAQWELGDLGIAVLGETVSGRDATPEQTLKDFAKAIQCGEKSMSEYKRMSEFYPKSARATFPNLCYTQYRKAWRLHRDSLDDALQLLERASSESWTVAEMEYNLAREADKPEPQDMTLAEVLERFGADTVVRVRETDDRWRVDIAKLAENQGDSVV